MTAALDAGVIRYIEGSVPWMSWNLLLALVPWALAVVLFRSGARRGRMWWAGAVVCLLFLPNAAYVLTDVVHLPGHVRSAPSDLVVVLGVLPLFCGLFTIGILAYVDTVRRVTSWVVAAGWRRRTWPLELLLHATSTVGIYAGRVHRFNSWDLFVRPGEVIATTANGFGRALPVAGMAVTFGVLSVGYLGAMSAMAGRRRSRLSPCLYESSSAGSSPSSPSC